MIFIEKIPIFGPKWAHFIKNDAKSIILATLERENLIDDRQVALIESEKASISGDCLKLWNCCFNFSLFYELTQNYQKISKMVGNV